MVGSFESVLSSCKEKTGNIFIIGVTQSGKSTLARQLQEKLGFNVVESSDWVKDYFVNTTFRDALERTAALTAKATEVLAKDPNYSFHYLNERLNNEKRNIVAGCRNPLDFVKLFDQTKDIAIIVHSNLTFVNPFETGLDVIKSYIHWVESTFNIKVSMEYKK